MTLTETLQIKERYLQFEDLRALAYCEKRWQEAGCPVERWQIINFLERMLQELKAAGPGYPKVLLLRKKEIQRNAFTVPQFAAAGQLPETCSSCSGTGWVPSASGHKPCTCPAGKP